MDGPDLREWAQSETTWDPSDATMEQDNRPDTAMVPYVNALLKRGVRTYQSCQGHVIENSYGDTVSQPGILWFNHPSFSPTRALKTNEFEQVSRVWGRENVPVWEVRYRGLAMSKSDLRASMDALWHALDLAGRPPHGEMNERIREATQ